MVNPTPASFYTDGGVYDESTVVPNDVITTGTTPSTSPSSFFADGSVVGTATVVSNDHTPDPTPSNTPSSSYVDGGAVDEGVVIDNDYTAQTVPTETPSSYYPNGNLYHEADVDAAGTYASDAAASAAAALASQTSSHTSEVNAKTSETNSKTSETNAATAAAGALASQTASHTSETNAAASAASAYASAQDAAGSAGAAFTSKQDAAGSAASASTSAGNAHTSEVNAASSAASAAASAASASTKVNKAGDTMTGGLAAPTFEATGGGLYAHGWGGDPNVSVIFMNNAQNHYIYHDGTNFSFNGGGIVSAGNGRLWGSSDFNYTPQANLGYTPVNRGGDTITGGLTVNGELVAAQNYIRFGTSGSGGYLIWSGGASYSLGSAGTIWHTGNVSQIVMSTRLAYGGNDVGNPGWATEYGGAVVTGAGVASYGAFWDNGVGGNRAAVTTVYFRWRYLQIQLNGGGWVTVGFA